ncbi:MAG: hypothetical protein ACKOBV_04600 [Candidatus Kapaibacterium sp.]
MSGIPPELVGAAVGIAFSGASTLIGVGIARWTSKRPMKEALSYVIGGMMVRLFLMAILTWIALTYWQLHTAAFTLSLMISFFLMLMVETFFFHTTTKRSSGTVVRKRPSMKR